jgi:hypothetical protein
MVLRRKSLEPSMSQWVIFDRVIKLSLRVDVRFDPESDQDPAATQYVAKEAEADIAKLWPTSLP